jgi:TM2 domain-containing membrane protein YozV
MMSEENSPNVQPLPQSAPQAFVPEGQAGYPPPQPQAGYAAPQPQPQPQPGYQGAPQPGAVGSGAYQPQPDYGFAPPQTPPAANSGYSLPYTGIGSAQKDKWVAAVLAFVLGSLGIHKFYLGYKNEGTIMLVISIVGAICTLGLGTAVMAVISLIEAVRYVILTQEDFQARYVIGRKGWL